MRPLGPHGESRCLLSLLANDVTIEMIGYADGGFGIVNNGAEGGYWPASEHIECVAAFQSLGNMIDAEHCIIFSREMINAVDASIRRAKANSN